MRGKKGHLGVVPSGKFTLPPFLLSESMSRGGGGGGAARLKESEMKKKKNGRR